MATKWDKEDEWFMRQEPKMQAYVLHRQKRELAATKRMAKNYPIGGKHAAYYAAQDKKKIAGLTKLIKKWEKVVKSRKNPMRHFPPLPGRGRPEKVRKIEMTTKMADGRAFQKTLTATKSKAYAQAKRVLEKGIKGKPVAHIMVEDIAVVRGGKRRKKR